MDSRVMLHPGDNRISLRRLIDEGVRVHSVVTDPPYGLVSIQKRFGKEGAKNARTEGNDGSFSRLSGGFMGKAWDGSGIERDPEFWALIYEILLPGGYVFAFSGSRTGHWQACAMEMAGFVMHPMHGWVFGCLDTETLAATPDGDKPYTELSAGDEVICYDPSTGEYSVQPILEVVEYDYEDTAFRLVGNHGEQVVSRNHRCIVERDGSEVFHFAETLEQQEVIPVLEDLRGLREALRLQGFESDAKPSVLKSLQGRSTLAGPRPDAVTDRRTQGTEHRLPGLLDRSLETECLATEDSRNSVLQPILSSEGDLTVITGAPFEKGSSMLDRLEQGVLCKENVRIEKPGVEERRDHSQQKGQPRSTADQVYTLSAASDHDDPQGRVCDGTSDRGGEGDGEAAAALGGGASHQPRRDGQPYRQPNAVRNQCGTQAVRAWAGHKTDLVRVVPFQYVGKVWCLRVPTGSFVAVRNGVAFPTGNSGFPKAHSADKAIDKMLGVEREVVGQSDRGSGAQPNKLNNHGAGDTGIGYADGSGKVFDITRPGSPEAQQWEGWAYGTQTQKPALEPIYLGQKPFSEKTGAANLLKHGVGAVNIDGCRVGTEGARNNGRKADSSHIYGDFGGSDRVDYGKGRHPSNLILDGSPEVVAIFPNGKSGVPGTRRKIAESHSMSGDLGLNGRVEVGYADEGSAARFFHQFTPDHYDEVDVTWSSDAKFNQARLLVDTEQSPPRVIAASGSAGSSEWNTFLFGSGLTDLCLTDSKSIIATKTSSTTASKTLNWLMRSLTNASTGDVFCETVSGSNHAGAVEQCGTSQITMIAKTAFRLGANRVASGTQLQISVCARSFADPLFYHAKAGKSDRAGSVHPTVKPIALMQYLVRHITPPGGTVLDPFAGSGTTAEAARREGFDCILMEAEPEYLEFLESRFAPEAVDEGIFG